MYCHHFHKPGWTSHSENKTKFSWFIVWTAFLQRINLSLLIINSLKVAMDIKNIIVHGPFINIVYIGAMVKFTIVDAI